MRYSVMMPSFDVLTIAIPFRDAKMGRA
jgi:hypothetical protein